MSRGTTPLRAKRDEERKTRTRAALMDAAEAVFSRQGFHNTLVSDLVAEAGVGQGTFYRHYENKRAIFEALFDRLVQRVLAGFSGAPADMPESLAEYRAISVSGTRHAIAVVQAHRSAVLLFLREGPAVDRAFQERVDQLQDRMAELATVYLLHAIERGFVPPCDALLVGNALIGQAIRVLTLWLDGRLGERTAEQITQTMVDLAVKGYAGKLEPTS